MEEELEECHALEVAVVAPTEVETRLARAMTQDSGYVRPIRGYDSSAKR